MAAARGPPWAPSPIQPRTARPAPYCSASHATEARPRTKNPKIDGPSARLKPSQATAALTSPAAVIAELNRIGGEHGIGRLDIVENRYVGMKSRGCYETPGGTIMLKGHRAIESITLDREAAHLKDEMMPRYASLIYNGYWWSPERRALQALIDETQGRVNGRVRLKLYKGNVLVTGRASESDSLFDERIATFEDDRGAYDQKDAAGFIRLNALRLRVAAGRERRRG